MSHIEGWKLVSNTAACTPKYERIVMVTTLLRLIVSKELTTSDTRRCLPSIGSRLSVSSWRHKPAKPP